MTEPVIAVRVGQVWKDWDSRYRHEEPGRRLRVDAIEGEYAICTVISDCMYTVRSRIGKTTRVKLSRLRPISTGYKLMQIDESDGHA